jgi:integrase
MTLTNKNIVFAKPGRHHAGVKGLYLYVSPDGQVKRFLRRFKSPATGRVTETGLGLWPAVSLEDAQAKAIELSRQIAQGICPIAAKRAARVAGSTFRECCEAYLETNKSGWRSTSHLNSAKHLLFGHGKLLQVVPVSTITADQIQGALSPLWTKYPNQARRALAMFENVLDYAKSRGMRNGDNPASWKGNMEYRFARQQNIARNHYTAMPYAEVPEFVRQLGEKQGMSPLALYFLILVAARSGEVLNMRFDEIDWDNKVWNLAAERTKQGRPHQVPLSTEAWLMLQGRRLELRGKSEYVFTGRKQEALSSRSMHHLMRAMGRCETVHGFRSSFRDWAGDTTEFPRELIEQCLGHAVGNGTEQAYRRGTALEKRRKIMEEWAQFCCGGGHEA